MEGFFILIMAQKCMLAGGSGEEILLFPSYGCNSSGNTNNCGNGRFEILFRMSSSASAQLGKDRVF